MSYLVIKCGGSVLDSLPDSFYQTIVEYKNQGIYDPIIVHGGGPLISSLLTTLGIEASFVNGLRVTTEPVLDVVEMALSGIANKQVVRRICGANGNGLGISGVDGHLLTASPLDKSGALGFVGKVDAVDTQILTELSKQGYIPVVSPLGMDHSGQRYNINADQAASAIAKALKAKLCFVSDIPGICSGDDLNSVILDEITLEEAKQLIAESVITGGMIPKVRAAMDCLLDYVPEVVILSGYEENSLAKFCQGKPVGTRLIGERGMAYA